jgi:hypothetical protein
MPAKKNNQNRNSSKKEIIDVKKAKSLFGVFMAKFTGLAQRIVNRIPTPDSSRWNRLGMENSWKFFAPLILAFLLILIVKLIPLRVFILLLVILIIYLFWSSKK